MWEPIEIEYFNWLCAKVLDPDTRGYVSLMGMLFNTEFVWFVPADKHRAEDGIELRTDFYRETNRTRDPLLDGRACSIFEMFVAFAERAEFQTRSSEKAWFWEFIRNLGLDQFRNITDSDIPSIEEILYTFTWRIYDPSGAGGMFPMSQTQYDQREKEIWYQFFEYLEDRGLY